MCEVYPRGGNEILKNKITPSTFQVTWLPPLRRQVWKSQCCQRWVGKKFPSGGKNFPLAASLKKSVLPTVSREKISLWRYIWKRRCCHLVVGKVNFPFRRQIRNGQCCQMWVVKKCNFPPAPNLKIGQCCQLEQWKWPESRKLWAVKILPPGKREKAAPVCVCVCVCVCMCGRDSVVKYGMAGDSE